ncbi:MAG: hypothetical protein PV345_01450 [Wolbachia sp.]|nr:hypothetical protein [Wolbachia sp.]
MKKLFTLAVLLASSLAGAVDLADLENKCYAGFNFSVGYGNGLNLKPSLILGYNYQKSSKLELEINSDIFPLSNIEFGLLVNYRYYPELNIYPVTLYFSGGLGGYFFVTG